MRCRIVVIGDELLIGQVTDTNSGYIARKLNPLGVEVVQTTIVKDRRDDIVRAVEEAIEASELVLITGGLGPTNDDITKHTLCEIFNGKMVLSESTRESNNRLFARTGKEMNHLTESQAFVPDCCEVLPNPVGTAPGMLFLRGEKVIISLPGVPYEMEKLITDHVVPIVKGIGTTEKIEHHTRLVYGFTESKLAIYLTDYEKALPETIKLAYLPKSNRIRLRLTANITDEAVRNDMQKAVNQLDLLLKDNILSYSDLTLEEILLSQLSKNKFTISTAESCTGGGVASKITSVSGASANFMGSVVAYDNSVKINLLGVDEHTIAENGVVSKVVVEQMARGVARCMNTDCAIATSGIAGPSGGTPQKPVGTIAIGVYCKGECRSYLVTIPSASRKRNVERFVDLALYYMILLLRV